MSIASEEDESLDSLLRSLSRDQGDAIARPGEVVGPYVLEAQIGVGGMGQVFRARHTEDRTCVAIKFLLSTTLASGAASRLRREAKALARIDHPNVVRVFGLDVHRATPYLVLEFVSGSTLRHVLAKGRLTPANVHLYALKMARALEAIHAQGVVHRDLKPENVLITEDGDLKILDFGLAKFLPSGSAVPDATVTTVGTVIGTPGYMSPEQVRGRRIDARSDIFVFGAMLYEMCCGARAFTGPSGIETMHSILTARPRSLGTLGALDVIVTRCLEVDPRARYPNAAKLIEALGSPPQRAEMSLTLRPPSSSRAKSAKASLEATSTPLRGVPRTVPPKANDALLIKGSAIRAILAFVTKNYGETIAMQQLEHIPGPAVREFLSSSWYPSQVAATLIENFLRTTRIKGSERDATLRALGDHVAREHLESTYRFLFSVMTPEKLLDMAPRIWATYFSGVTVQIRSQNEDFGGRLEISGLDGCRTIGAVASGWLSYAYTRCGAEVAEVSEVRSRGDDTASPITLSLHWAWIA